MPYIDNNRRNDLDCVVAEIENHIDSCVAGDLNYLVTTVLDRYMLERGVNYATINLAIGVLECAKLELYRRIAAPYEDRKISTNGDVFTTNERENNQ